MKFAEWLEETTTTAGIEQPLARGKVDVVGAGCPDGYKWDKDLKECVPTGKVSEYQEIHRTDRYDDIANDLIKKLKGKKRVSFREVEQAIIDEFAPHPFDKYDYQEVEDRLKKKRIKVGGTSKLKESLNEVTLTDPGKLTAEWKKKAKENSDVAHWMHIADVYKKAATKCQEKFRAHLNKMNMSKAEINKEMGM